MVTRQLLANQAGGTLAPDPEIEPRASTLDPCAAVFEHIYESYPERDQGVYAEPEGGPPYPIAQASE